MTQLKITATKRGVGKKGRAELPEDSIPGVVYGREFESTPIAVDLRTVTKLFHEAGTNRIVELDIDGKTQDILFKEVQFNPVTDVVNHFDLYAIVKGEKIKADVPIESVGDSPAVVLGAHLASNIDTIEVEAIPSKLPEKFVLDVSVIKEIGDSLHISDIDVPEGVEILDDAETTVFKAEEIREMVVEDETAEEEELGEGEEGEEGSEGEEGEESEGSDDSDASPPSEG